MTLLWARTQPAAFASAAPSSRPPGQHALRSLTPMSPPKLRVNISKRFHHFPMQNTISRCRDCLSKSMLPSRGRKKKPNTTQLSIFLYILQLVLGERLQVYLLKGSSSLYWVGNPATTGKWFSPWFTEPKQAQHQRWWKEEGRIKPRLSPAITSCW